MAGISVKWAFYKVSTLPFIYLVAIAKVAKKGTRKKTVMAKG